MRTKKYDLDRLSTAIKEAIKRQLVFGQPTVARPADTVELVNCDLVSFRVYDEDNEPTASELPELAIENSLYNAIQNAESATAHMILRSTADRNKLDPIELSSSAANSEANALVIRKTVVKMRSLLNFSPSCPGLPYIIVGRQTLRAIMASPGFECADLNPGIGGGRNGFVGTLFGFDVLFSPYTPAQDGREFLIAGVAGAFEFSHKLTEPEPLRDPKHFADIVRELHAYAIRVTSPVGLATVEATFY